MQLTFTDFVNFEGGVEKYVRRIGYEDTKPFLLNIHYARRMPCITDAFGLFIDMKLVGVCTFGQPASPSLCIGLAGQQHKMDVLELNRLALLPEYNGGNNASYLVGKSLKMLPNGTFVVSYADTAWSHVGYIYQATNFLYTGKTKERTDKYSESGHSRHYLENETRRQFRSAKHRYVFLVGDKRTKREMAKDLRYPVFKEYPKGDEIRYDVNDPKPIITG